IRWQHRYRSRQYHLYWRGRILSVVHKPEPAKQQPLHCLFCSCWSRILKNTKCPVHWCLSRLGSWPYSLTKVSPHTVSIFVVVDWRFVAVFLKLPKWIGCARG